MTEALPRSVPIAVAVGAARRGCLTAWASACLRVRACVRACARTVRWQHLHNPTDDAQAQHACALWIGRMQRSSLHSASPMIGAKYALRRPSPLVASWLSDPIAHRTNASPPDPMPSPTHSTRAARRSWNTGIDRALSLSLSRSLCLSLYLSLYLSLSLSLALSLSLSLSQYPSMQEAMLPSGLGFSELNPAPKP